VPRAPLPIVGVTHKQDVLTEHLGRHYSSFIALKGSCARPNPSHRLRLSPWSVGLCRLSLVPAGRWPFPTLSLQSLCSRLDPYPATSLGCIYPFLLQELRPHKTGKTFGTWRFPCNATSTGCAFRGCSHSFTFRLPHLLDPQVASTVASLGCQAAGPFTPRIARVVTQSGMWYRYMFDMGN
jgi:hypothetical protein